MVVTMNPTNTKCIKAGNNTNEKIPECKYLGTLITSNNLSTEIHYKLQLTNKCNRINFKHKLYKTSIRYVMIYE